MKDTHEQLISLFERMEQTYWEQINLNINYYDLHINVPKRQKD